MFAATPRFSGVATATGEERICRWLSEGFMVWVGYIAAAVFSCAVPLSTMTICFLRLTVCHTWVCGTVMFAVAMIAILGSGLVGICMSVTAGLGDR